VCFNYKETKWLIIEYKYKLILMESTISLQFIKLNKTELCVKNPNVMAVFAQKR